MPTVMMVRAQITEQPIIMMKKNRPPPTKKPKNAKIRLLWNNQNVKDREKVIFIVNGIIEKKSGPEILLEILWIILIVKLKVFTN